MEKYHHGDLRHQLLEEGLLMIQNDGIDKLSLRKLTGVCNVSEAAPYSHFKNKEDLVKEMQRYVTDKLYDSLVTAYDESPDRNTPRGIYRIGAAYVLFSIKYPAYFNFIFRQNFIQIDLSMHSQNDFRPFQFFKEKSYEVYRKLGFGDEQIKFSVIGMWAKVHGIASIAAMKQVTTDFKWEEVLEEIILEKE